MARARVRSVRGPAPPARAAAACFGRASRPQRYAIANRRGECNVPVGTEPERYRRLVAVHERNVSAGAATPRAGRLGRKRGWRLNRSSADRRHFERISKQFALQTGWFVIVRGQKAVGTRVTRIRPSTPSISENPVGTRLFDESKRSRAIRARGRRHVLTLVARPEACRHTAHKLHNVRNSSVYGRFRLFATLRAAELGLKRRSLPQLRLATGGELGAAICATRA